MLELVGLLVDTVHGLGGNLGITDSSCKGGPVITACLPFVDMQLFQNGADMLGGVPVSEKNNHWIMKMFIQSKSLIQWIMIIWLSQLFTGQKQGKYKKDI